MKLSELHSMIQKMQPIPASQPHGVNQQELLNRLGLDSISFYQELEMESKYVDTHQDVSHSNIGMNLHSHSFYEILYCRSNCGAEYLVGADRYRLQKGDIVFIAPGTGHRPLLPEQMTEPYKRDVLWVSTELIDILLQMFPDLNPDNPAYTSLLRTAGTSWESLGELFRTGIRESEQKAKGWEMAVLGNTIQLLSLLYRAFMDRSATLGKAEKPDLPGQVMAYVEEHLSRRISLAEVARHFYVSESTVSQTFRKKLGVSFYQYVTQRRLISAKTMIEKGMQLETVSEQVGFADYSAFYRAFKQAYGISPRQYRKLQEGNEQGM